MTLTLIKEDIIQLQNVLLEVPAKYSLQILQWINNKVNEQNPQITEDIQEKSVTK